LLGYFTCTQAGIFPDTANCAVGRYFYCPQANSGKYFKRNYLLMVILFYILAPIVATCPDGQKFNRLTNVCDATYNCT